METCRSQARADSFVFCLKFDQTSRSHAQRRLQWKHAGHGRVLKYEGNSRGDIRPRRFGLRCHRRCPPRIRYKQIVLWTSAELGAWTWPSQLRPRAPSALTMRRRFNGRISRSRSALRTIAWPPGGRSGGGRGRRWSPVPTCATPLSVARASAWTRQTRRAFRRWTVRGREAVQGCVVESGAQSRDRCQERLRVGP